MKHSKRIVSRNGNQGGSGTSRLQSVSSRKGVGHQLVHVAGLGAWQKSTAGFCPEAPSPDPRRSDGGQASSSGLFSLRVDGNTGSAPQAASVQKAAWTGIVAAHGLNSKGLRRTHTLTRRPLVPDEFDGYGLARPSTPAMQAAARASTQRDAMHWHEAAKLLASALND